MRYLALIGQFFRILFRRLREQGPATTIKWLYAVGLPLITRRLSLRYSRVTAQLYIGVQVRPLGLRALEAEGIATSLNLREEHDDRDFGVALKKHRYVPIADNTAPSLDNLDEGVAFIRDAINSGEKVYVHCGSGVGRAPTMAAAYLISEGSTVEEAVATITAARPFIRILPEQYARLEEYAVQYDRQASD